MDKLSAIFNKTTVGTLLGVNAGLQFGMGNELAGGIWTAAAVLQIASETIEQCSRNTDNKPKPPTND